MLRSATVRVLCCAGLCGLLAAGCAPHQLWKLNRYTERPDPFMSVAPERVPETAYWGTAVGEQAEPPAEAAVEALDPFAADSGTE